MKVLNLPIALIKKYKTSKSDKELLAFAVGIKCLYSNSVLTEVTPCKVMKLFHVSHAKAKDLIKRAGQSSLFRCVKDSIIVTTFKSSEEKKSVGRTPFTYKSDYCYKLDKQAYSIRSLVTELNRALLLCAVNAYDRNKFPQTSKKKPCVPLQDLTLRKLSNISGISRSECHRLMSYMSMAGEISKVQAHAKMVLPVVNETTVEEWRKSTGRKKFMLNPHDRTGWIVVPCVYSIAKRYITERFKHIIYTHKRRMVISNESTFMQCITNPEHLDFL